ncbi:hypothetical protein JXA47_12030 [Candidatus Sumerlaeota bacterium]|nr:hypothetical protein [Candidatus Sumerlaeota bacterium]
MPTYDYRCTSCDTVHEVFHGFRESGPDTCPACGAKGTLRKLISAGSGVIFKGTGFYETDYRRSNGNGGNGKSSVKQETSEKPASESTSTSKAETAKTATDSKDSAGSSD